MTDLEKFTSILKEFGIPFTQTNTDDPVESEIEVQIGGNEDHPTVNGYLGFYQIWAFMADGRFISTGAWE